MPPAQAGRQWGGGRLNDDAGHFDLATLDAPLIAPGRPSLVDFTNALQRMAGGVQVNLFNHVWGTNFRMWYDDACFRFTVTCT